MRLQFFVVSGTFPWRCRCVRNISCGVPQSDGICVEETLGATATLRVGVRRLCFGSSLLACVALLSNMGALHDNR